MRRAGTVSDDASARCKCEICLPTPDIRRPIGSVKSDRFLGLDHIRALAALLVFCWHFMHGSTGFPVANGRAPAIFPLALFDEGAVGVALFMTLSGYLFAKLLADRQMNYRQFYANRALRILPLLLVVIAISACIAWLYQGADEAGAEFWMCLAGLVVPILPNGGWSITVEFHFYLLLPFLLRLTLVGLGRVLVAAIALRLALWIINGEVQDAAYWTIIGRIDQFVLGIMAFRLRHLLVGRHRRAATVALAFTSLYWLFDYSGGMSASQTWPIWIVLPTMEGAAFACLIGWYDSLEFRTGGRISRAVALAGEYSFSIYLLHPFFVFGLAPWIHRNVLDLSNFYVALSVAIVCFIAMMPLGWLSMTVIEQPFLRLRRRCISVAAPERDLPQSLRPAA